MSVILLTQGQNAIVDAADCDWLNQWKWYARWNPHTKSFYACRSVGPKGKQYPLQMHRLILGLDRGDERQGDHENHDTLDNRRENLRIANRHEQARNQRIRSINKAGFKGVNWDKCC